jgi:hypothetical protein
MPMRHWLFHPIVFYPLVAAFAVLVIAISLSPQSWPRDPAEVRAVRDGEWFVYQGEGFNSPEVGPSQEMTVVRDFLGRPQTLRIAERGRQATPNSSEQGTRILLSPDDAAALSGRPITIEISYNPLAVNAATGLAVSLRGEGASEWVSQSTPPQPTTLRFRLPPTANVNAIGLLTLSNSDDQAYGLEITRIRLTPQT